MKYFFLLGATDPEMREIEAVLQSHEEEYGYAMQHSNPLERVTPGGAYNADPVNILGGTTLVLVECEPTVVGKLTPGEMSVIVIDHHREGDPGYEMGADQYWQASSIGQVCTLLDIEPTQNQRLLAAMDHCPAAALRGDCPDIPAEEVLLLKCREIARGCETNGWVVRTEIERATDKLRLAASLVIGGQEVKDLRTLETSHGYSLEYLTAQVAALKEGEAVLLTTKNHVGGAPRWVLCGHATPKCVTAFMENWAVEKGLVNVYGVPARGYAGGYLVRRGKE